MSFRKKLLLLFAATVLLCVAVISASVYSTIRRSFEQADQDRANAVAAQFRSEFQRRGLEVARKVESVAASETVQRIALDMNRGATDPGEYVSEARTLARSAAARLSGTRRRSRHHPLLRAVAGEIRISRSRDSARHASRAVPSRPERF